MYKLVSLSGIDIITQYGSTVYNRDDDHFQFVVQGTSNKLNLYMYSKGTSG